MNWDSISEIIGDAAPILGGLLGGPVGAGAGKLLATVLGVKPDPVSIKQAIANDPDAMAKIAKMELDYEVDLRELALEEMKAVLNDRQHARETHKASWVPPVLTFILMAFFGASMYMLSTDAIPTANRDILHVLVGNLVGFCGAAIAFWLGAMEKRNGGKL
jgi:hypothetical protein